MESFGIKVIQQEKKNLCTILLCDYLGETNSIYNTDQYACTFSKMIPSWRQTWNERTNDSTDLYFPFGFVQVYIEHF